MINIARAEMLSRLKLLCSKDKACSDVCSRFVELQELSNEDCGDLLSCLAELLLNPETTATVAKHFFQNLPQLMLLALSNLESSKKISSVQAVDNSILHKKRCVLLGKLTVLHSDALKCALKFFSKNPAPFEDVTKDYVIEPTSKKIKRSKSYKNQSVSDTDIATACLHFLRASPEDFRKLWNWATFLDLYLNHPNYYVRWLACSCAALVSGMCDAERSHLINSKLFKEEAVKCPITFDSILSDLVTIRGENCELEQSAVAVRNDDFFVPLDSVVNVGDVILPRNSEPSDEFKSSLVLVDSTRTNVESVALGVAAGRAVCLQGPVGCGKTALVEYLAGVTGRAGPPSFMKIQLGDQIDSKMLLGMYRCTDIPGEFVWQPGVLTQAVLGGHWLLLEDIDSCPTDVLAVLASLLENKQLNVPGYRDAVRATPGFQLFLTQRLVCSGETLHQQQNIASSMLGKLWLQVQVEPLSRSELIEVVQTMYPPLKTVASRFVDVYLLFSAGGHHSTLAADSDSGGRREEVGTACGRLISTRDLLKWCARTTENFSTSSQESALKALQDAIDIFCWSLSDAGLRLKLSKSVAAVLGIIDTKATYFCDSHKPSVSTSGPHLFVGRTKLKKLEEGVVTLNRKTDSTFTFTRPASCILERVACCVVQNEPVLLVGETGVGKTSSIQYLAQSMGQKLIVINMNQQSDSADLLGGYKPVELKYVIAPIREKFETLFRSLFDVEENYKFLGHIAACVSKRNWALLIRLMKHSCTAALKRFDEKAEIKKKGKRRRKGKAEETNSVREPESNGKRDTMRKSWVEMSEKIRHLECQLKNTESPIAFSFVEGSLVRALREGYWVLLDEINLATAETLECLSGLLEGSSGSLSLLERGDREALFRHSNFRLFAAMNPASNIGKKELPPGIRNRFTEFFVDELTDKQDLLLLCSNYLSPLSLPSSLLDSVVRFYVNIRGEASKTLTDGVGDRPHYSLRTFCRALQVAATNPCQAARRSVFEGLLLSFLTQLDGTSRPIVEKLLSSALVGKGGEDSKSLLCPLADIHLSKQCVMIEGYPVVQGTEEPIVPEKYILTPTVRRNLKDLVRVVSLARLPILLQGETSVGKTSLIKYLAESSGNRCVRINNHEHTDLQEYIGCYSADEHGKLTFKEGVLVESMRKGYWIILDELNLAPSDVLEALNRVLDDNRELFVTETQETIKAHPNFMLFGTQNPPGRYGGRKVLSRAFRNRFVEFHLEDIPPAELETILHQRCDMPLSYCKKLVAVMFDLQRHRTNSAAFAGKEGFITLRDLFRWGERYRLAHFKQSDGKFYDWDQHIADEGFLLLAGRVRMEEERKTIIQILKKHIKRDVDVKHLFNLDENTSTVTRHILEQFLKATPSGFQHIVWTANMRQIAVLLGKACEFREPALLVGETGCGKTTICQFLAASNGKSLNIVNCHMHSESADFLGGLRPVRDHSTDSQRLFEWVDGPLIKSMLAGGLFLADEISLAEDSVLERLNSLLEPERTLLIAEKGTGPDGHSEQVKAADGFHFIGTMNPGGDYGKKELSPALRNRFTEIWCEPCLERTDLIAVVHHNLDTAVLYDKQTIAVILVDFLEWFSSTELAKKMAISMRDVLTWVNFINIATRPDVGLPVEQAYVHGACLTFLDGFGSGLTSVTNSTVLEELHSSVLKFLVKQVNSALTTNVDSEMFTGKTLESAHFIEGKFGVKPFYIKKGTEEIPTVCDFQFSAPTTHSNLLRLLRGMQLDKALLLEGSPGVGKTSLVTALARASGHRLVRINLSDQTDVSDLFGADLPVEGGSGGEFAWRDGPFLQALRAGHWILLDELNLASQSVLEGLNAVLDHRGDVFIPELGQTFHIRPGLTRIFGCQNPQSQGGARKGLPKSFLNRFTQVFMDTLTESDLEFICSSQFPLIPGTLISRMVEFNGRVSKETSGGGDWGSRGAPWEFNLRDITRWCQAMLTKSADLSPGNFVQLIYVDRMRTLEDKKRMKSLYENVFGEQYPLRRDTPLLHVAPDKVFIGDVNLRRVAEIGEALSSSSSSLCVLQRQLPTLHSLARCVSLNWMSILVGSSGSGKSSVVRLLAQLTGRELRTLSVNSAMDTTEILGGFEQVDFNRHLDEISGKIDTLVLESVRRLLLDKNHQGAKKLLFLLSNNQSYIRDLSVSDHNREFQSRIERLFNILNEFPRGSLSAKSASLLDQLRQKLECLSRDVSKEGNLNAGGRFEWIDSVLVKSLIDGCWLLVDNVNLCSATVLDRLNGLLEPQGVLTIGERGVGVNGEFITITPHPDFRLFLTMDPRRGEISRAMRNRGVEIFLLDPNDAEVESESLDRATLLNFIGFSDAKQQAALFHIHECMANLVAGPDKPGLTHMLQAATLTVQARNHGLNFNEAFLSACIRVYVRSRISDTLTVRRQMFSVLEETLKATKTMFNDDLSVISRFTTLSLLNTADLWTDSVWTEMKQRSSVLVSLADSDDEADVSKLKRLLNLTDFEGFSDIKDKLLLVFYLMCSGSEVNLCHRWLSERVQDKHLIDLSASITAVLTGNPYIPATSYPWDSRWLPDCTQETATTIKSEYTANRISINMHHCEMTSSEKVDPSDRSLSILNYSKGVYKGTASDDITSNEIILRVWPFIEEIDENLSSLVSCVDLELNNEDWWQMRRAIFLRRKLRNFCSSTSLSVDLNVLEEITQILTVYVQWVSKVTVPAISKAASHHHPLLDVHLKMRELVENDTTFVDIVVKVIRSEGVYPTPHLSADQVNLNADAEALNSKLALWEPGKPIISIDSLYRKLQVVLSPKGLEAWKIVKIAHSLLIQGKPGVAECIEEAKKILTEIDTRLNSDEEKESFLKEVEFDRCALLPLTELAALKLGTALRASMLQQSENCERLSGIVDGLLTRSATAPPALAGAVKATLEGPRKDDQTGTLIPWNVSEKLVLFLQNEATSPSLLPSYVWTRLANDPLSFLASRSESDSVEERAPLHSPVLSRCAGTLLFSNDSELPDALVSVPLKDYDKQLKKLSQIQSFFWRNSSTFSERDFDVQHNNEVCAKVLVKYLENLIRRGFSKLPGDEKDVDVLMAEMFSDGAITGSYAKADEFTRAFLGAYNVIQQGSEGNLSDAERLERVGRAWVMIGATEVQLCASLDFLDPVLKHKLKLGCVEEEILSTHKELLAFSLTMKVKGISYEENSPLLHPHVASLYSNLKRLEEKQKKYHKDRGTPQRPTVSQFSALAREIRNYACSIGSLSTLLRLLARAESLVSCLHSKDEKPIEKISSLLLELQTWDESQCRVQRILSERFLKWYPDIVKPLIAASVILCHGMTLIADSLRKARNFFKSEDLNEVICAFARFPSVNESSPSPLSVVNILTSASVARLLEMSATGTDEEMKPIVVEPRRELYRLLKSALMELNNVVVSTGTLGSQSSNEWQALQDILSQFVSIWQEQETQRRLKELQEESLYKTRGALRGDVLSEEEEIAQGLQETFPSQREEDFGDIEATSSLDEATHPPKTSTKELSGMLTKEDATQLCQLHANLVLHYTSSLWIHSDKSGTVDFISPWIERSSAAARLLNINCHSMNESVDQELCLSWALAAAVALDSQKPTEFRRIKKEEDAGDFYHDSCVDEVKQCLVVLDGAASRVEELLSEWPEHPTLKTIMVVIDRIKTFPLTSPISRFLTGLEILLGKLQEWEENAHSGVSLAVHSRVVTELIVQWRRLELSCWKNCLESAARKIQSSASRWWFHLYSLVDGFVSGNISTPRELLTSLERFMEESPLGEFHSRLELLLVFHCHSLHLKPSERRSELSAILWNLHGFYSLFKDSVSSKIRELSSPIEKKIKGFVKIARWNDISFWAIKEAVHKTHHTLHKHVREYEKVLLQPSRPALTAPTGDVDRVISKNIPKADSDISAFIAKSSLKQLIPAEYQVSSVSGDTSALSHSPASLFGRARTLTKEALTLWECPEHIRSIDAFAGDIANTVQHLSSQQVDRTLERKKQISQAKNMVQMKRKALADLFRNLQSIGLSHRTGLAVEESDAIFRYSLLPPLDLKVALKKCLLGSLPAKSADEHVVSAVEGADNYFVHSIAKNAHLITSLRTPHSDLGPVLIQRLRGFASHLMDLNHRQKNRLAESSKLLVRSRLLISQFAGLAKSNHVQSTLLHWRRRLNQLLQTSLFTLRQYSILLQACPTESGESSVLLNPDTPPMMTAVYGDACWSRVNADVNGVLTGIETLYAALEKHKLCPEFEDIDRVVTEEEASVIRRSFEQLRNTAVELKNVQSPFEKTSRNAAIQSLHWLSEHILHEVEDFENSQKAESNMTEGKVKINCDSVVRLVLISVQSVFKTRKRNVVEKETSDIVEATPGTDEVKEDEAIEDEIDSIADYKLVNKHLTEAVISSLEANLSELRMDEICQELLKVISKFSKKAVNEDSMNQALSYVPLLQQWALLCQSIIHQQAAAWRASTKLLSILLSVFTSVAQKGFCMPDDLKSEDDNKDEGEDNKAGGMGLGDGEGEKDVSDRIESEDQLEGAYKEGEERKEAEEEKDCKEEDNAVEMSEDFEGKHQDVEPKEGSDDSEDEEDDGIDAEKEMGDTGEGADELDNQIWGSDPEDEEDEEVEGDDRRDTGEQMGEKELAASEDQNKTKGDNDEDDAPRKDDERKEINEMQEPEVDDDQVDPFHGKQQPEEEPEPMDLPDDLRMDDGEKEADENETENPFDIDAMKDEIPPEPEKMDETTNDDGQGEKEENENNECSDEEDSATGEAEKDDNEAGDEEKTEEDSKREDGGVKDDEKGGDDPAEEDDQEEIKSAEEAKPSSDDASAEAAEKADRSDSGSKDQVDTAKQDSADVESEERQEDDGDPGKDEQKGVGQADTSQVQQGHQSDQSGKQPRPDRTKEELSEQRKKQKPGHSDEKRTLGDTEEPAKKKLKTVDAKEEKQDENANEEEEEEPAAGRDDGDLYEHIQEAKREGDTQAIDTATKEQAEKQSKIAEEDEEASPPDDQVPMDVDSEEDKPNEESAEKLKPEQVSEKKKKEKHHQNPSSEERMESDVTHEVEGETVETLGAARGPETSYHTRWDELSIRPVAEVQRDVEALRVELQSQIATWHQPPIGREAGKTWQAMSSVVGSLAHDLCEQLRLIMEPTQASRLRGDFRTGRRINMRKVIPYIASQYRKDKIWLRRTKPSKREYQIVLAIDDSSSMADNQSKELAFESVALVSQALTLLEAGELGVLSFGETARLVHRLGEPFTQNSGGRLLQEFTFEQRRTQVAALLNFATEMLSSSRSTGIADHAQLLVIVSDGRGIFSEGHERVKAAVQRARQADILLLFLVVDNPKNKDSIFDIRVPEFSGGKLVRITPYMDSFPFPFYLILQDLESLPRVLSDALRQWFELVAKHE